MAEMLPTNFELRFKYCLLDTGQWKKRCCLKIQIKFFLTTKFFFTKNHPNIVYQTISASFLWFSSYFSLISRSCNFYVWIIKTHRWYSGKVFKWEKKIVNSRENKNVRYNFILNQRPSDQMVRILINRYHNFQCCGAGAGAGAARSRNFCPEPELEPVYWSFGSGSGSRSN